jgi:hypothetical protein
MNRDEKFGAVVGGRKTNNVPAPAKQKYGVVQFSDLSGPTNPQHIIGAQFLLLKQALDRGDDPDSILDALYDWLHVKTQRGLQRTEVDKLLRLKPELALTRLIDLIGGGMRQKSLPPLVIQTLQRVLQAAAKKHVSSREQRLNREQTRVGGIKKRYGVESAAQLAASLLD